MVVLQVIAHEISHSWTGNLVTNKTWEHFWSVQHIELSLNMQIRICKIGTQGSTSHDVLLVVMIGHCSIVHLPNLIYFKIARPCFL